MYCLSSFNFYGLLSEINLDNDDDDDDDDDVIVIFVKIQLPHSTTVTDTIPLYYTLFNSYDRQPGMTAIYSGLAVS